MTLSIDNLRRAAKQLHRAFEAGDKLARERLKQHPPRPAGELLKRADFLHVVAQENNFASWPQLKHAAETMGLDRAAKVQRLKVALFHGRNSLVEALLQGTPDLAAGHLGLQIALYDLAAVRRAVLADATLATKALGPRRPILHLAFSRWIHARPDLAPDMIGIAQLLVDHGADVNDGFAQNAGSDHRLSALYGAIGHADNMVLGRWLLDHGADPNDGESLYHATELGHHQGLAMLLEAGADPKGTNALLRAMDFQDHAAVEMLLAHGARADDFNDAEVGGESPWVVPALHQAARRGCDTQMVQLLLQAGADPARVYQGASAYGYACVHGNQPVIRAIEARRAEVPLSHEESLLAKAAKGEDVIGSFIDPNRLPPAYTNLIREILHLPGRLDYVKRLVVLGLPFDTADGQGLTPIQLAGWEGLPEVLNYFLSLGCDLSHVNGYGGTLLSTILHGSENNPERAGRDYIACLERVLHHGVALPKHAITMIGREDLRAFLEDWAEARPGQVV
ncbi:ankyrin repeat domain-containing protein [Pelagimonas varians]|uniref:Ankyrin repeats (3 copies) n=1 Tax=Pelagimonas varians TaxID=696760 RepID=A0A238K0E3_9RHOB|nr:ankyrin repeat domain-containing protein [Pelagimonas varians]PYG33282.1 ankyrin repeat protein [Pelagimonas varians]SMX36223.1 Ankyrin repeats (3 copies) [Pelagimonas varians]